MTSPPAARSDQPPAKRCARCGACTPVCPVYRATGNEIYSARGKQHLAEVFAGAEPSPVFEDIYSKCLLCGACSAVCPQDIDVSAGVIEARSGFSRFYGEHGYQKFLARQALNRPELLGGARVLGKAAAAILFGRLPPASGLRLRLAMLAEPPLPAALAARTPAPPPVSGFAREICYFPGCAANYLYPEIIAQIGAVLAGFDCGLDVPAGLGCCGLAAMAAGDVTGAKRLARQNIRALEGSDGPILVSCGSCFAHLASYEHIFEDDAAWRTRAALVAERAIEIGPFLEALLQEERPAAADDGAPLRVFYHDPCHMRHDAGITEEPRSLLRRFSRITLVELPDGPQCCGQGGLFHVGAPELSAAIRDDLAGKIVALAPDLITTTCSGCLMQLKSAMAAKNAEIPVVHLAALVATLASSDDGAPRG